MGSRSTIEELLSKLAQENPRMFSPAELKKMTSNFKTMIGSGGFGDVYKGQMSNGVEVAVRVDKGVLTEKEFMGEVATLGKTHHRNVVKLYGFCYGDEMKALVYEYIENGSLDSILFRNHLSIEWEKLFDIAIEIANGLSYLHESCQPQIIHYDIKPDNVLIDSNLSAKITGFELANVHDRSLSFVEQTVVRGTLGYTSPEVGKGFNVTSKSDVYSFGMMLFEILRRKRNSVGPGWFPGDVAAHLENGELERIFIVCGIEEKDKAKAERLSVVALLCTQYSPQDRPNMSTVVKMLRGEIQLPQAPTNPFPFYDRYDDESLFETSEGSPQRASGSILFSVNSQEDIEGASTKKRIVVGIQKVLNELRSDRDFNWYGKDKLEEVLVETLEVLNALKEGAYGSSSRIEMSLGQLDRKKTNMVGLKQYSNEDLTHFTKNFTIPIGSGAYGDVFQGELPGGVQVAVKRLINIATDVNTFMAEVGTMSSTLHRNLVRLYGYCFEDNMKALVYEYMEKKSLDMILRQKDYDLQWKELYDIAIGTARGLSYLHDGCHDEIIHYDVKPANVLLDSKFSPKVADFGLAKISRRDASHISLVTFRGTRKYAAPEMFSQIPVTSKSDIYSYGMVLFDLLEWKRNVEDQEWFPALVWDKFKKEKLDELMGECGIEDMNRNQAKILCTVALWCTQHRPNDRPPMGHVVQVLKGFVKLPPPKDPLYPYSVSSNPGKWGGSSTSTSISGPPFD